MSTDLTLVVIAHDRTTLGGPTMRAADLAVEEARSRGCSVQTLVALGAATEATSAYFGQARFGHWERRACSEGDPAAVRNAIVPDCDGRYVAFLEAGDLVSENWLAEAVPMLDAAARRGERVVAHPELTVSFDGASSVQLNVDQESPLFTPHHLYARPYHDATCVAPRAAHEEVPYETGDLTRGPDHQGARFTIETMAAGWRHRVVPDTVVFTRRLDLSPDPEGRARGSLVPKLPATRIDRIRGLGGGLGRG